jgi:hypothetical protein
MTNDKGQYYIVKQENGTCQISIVTDELVTDRQFWGPFSSQEEAIAKKIGLIRAGKCQPN